jgi:ribonucleoside-diphosphate reductase alpha chain
MASRVAPKADRVNPGPVYPVFSKETAVQNSLTYFAGDELAATTWVNKYAMRNLDGKLVEDTPEAMHRRMAAEFARMEEKFRIAHPVNGSAIRLSPYGRERKALNESSIFKLFDRFRYIVPQGSVMSSLGNPFVIASLSNCVVLPEIHDSYGGILYTDQQLVQLFKRRCGVGIDLSSLRPAGMRVSNAAGTTSGPVSFMERFSNTTREVAQNGRRGALMMTMDVAHPDIEDFVTIKQDLTKVTGANISVRLSDEFMTAVRDDQPYTLRWPIDSTTPTVQKTIQARDLWNTIIACAHQSAEPGLIFWDRQHDYSTSSVYPGYRNVSTNPCSEIAMQGGDSCRLMAINLYSFVNQPFTKEASFNFDLFWKVTYEGQRLSDDLVELELESIERIFDKIANDSEPEHIKQVERETWQLLYDAGKKGRRTGLGFTALADALAALGLKYDSQEAIDMIDQIMRSKCEAEFTSSIDLAIERGAFVGFDPAVENTSEFVHMLQKDFPDVYQRMMTEGRRNISISTVAPTGTLSLLTQTSSGIEPVFLTSYKRRRKLGKDAPHEKVAFVDDLGDQWEEFTVYHHALKTWMAATGATDEAESPFAGATAPEINWERRVTIQGVVQKYVTHSISSTINLPNEVAVEEVGAIYLDAWKEGLKGITVYRDGSRSGVLVADTPKETQVQLAHITESQAPERPETLDARIVRFSNEDEKWIAVVGLLEGRPYEIFTGKAEDSFYLPNYVEQGWVTKAVHSNGESRYDFRYIDKDGYKVSIEGLSRSFNPEFWNYAKLISGVLRQGMPLAQVVDLVANLNLSDHINTWKNGVARALKQFVPDGTVAKDHACPECGDPHGVIYEEGCLKCKSCGNTKCG